MQYFKNILEVIRKQFSRVYLQLKRDVHRIYGAS